jgi:hypothetical protein
MNLRTLLIAGVSALVGLSVAMVTVGATKPDTPSEAGNTWTTPQMIGRYQMVPVTGAHVHVCDTTTGEIWTNNDGVWTQKGTPPHDRP